MTLTWPSWLCVAVMLVSALAGVFAWLPWSNPNGRLPVYLALLSVIPWSLGAISLIGQSMIALQHRSSADIKIRLPRVYWQIFGWAAGYFLVLFIGSAIYYPHGVDLGASVDLRIASGATLFFGAASLGFTHWSALRAQAIQAAP